MSSSPSDATTIEITVPDLGEAGLSARVTDWVASVDSEVGEGEGLCRIALAGGIFEIGSSAAGTLIARCAPTGTPVRSGDVLALVRIEAAPTPEEPAYEASSSVGGNPNWSTWRSPVVLALAREHDINLDEVVGTGYWGRIRKIDVVALIDEDGVRQSSGDRSLVHADGRDRLSGGDRASGSPP